MIPCVCVCVCVDVCVCVYMCVALYASTAGMRSPASAGTSDTNTNAAGTALQSAACPACGPAYRRIKRHHWHRQALTVKGLCGAEAAGGEGACALACGTRVHSCEGCINGLHGVASNEEGGQDWRRHLRSTWGNAGAPRARAWLCGDGVFDRMMHWGRDGTQQIFCMDVRHHSTKGTTRLLPFSR